MPYLCFPFTKQGWPSSMLSRWCCFWIQRDGHPSMRTTIWGLNYVQLTRGGMTRGPFIPCFDPGMCQYCIITQCLPDLVIFRDFSICIYIYILRRFATSFRWLKFPLGKHVFGAALFGQFLVFFDLAWDRREVRRARLQMAWDPNIWVVVSMSFPISCAHALHSTYHKQT